MIKILDRGIETLRQPDRNPRCYEMTDQERLDIVRKWDISNIYKKSDGYTKIIELQYVRNYF